MVSAVYRRFRSASNGMWGECGIVEDSMFFFFSRSDSVSDSLSCAVYFETYWSRIFLVDCKKWVSLLRPVSDCSPFRALVVVSY